MQASKSKTILEDILIRQNLDRWLLQLSKERLLADGFTHTVFTALQVLQKISACELPALMSSVHGYTPTTALYLKLPRKKKGRMCASYYGDISSNIDVLTSTSSLK